jgi:predicted RNase H-like HicB family nuclease
MAKLIIEPKKGKDGQIDYIVTYHDPKSDNQFMVTTTNNLEEAVQRLKETLENEVKAMQEKK